MVHKFPPSSLTRAEVLPEGALEGHEWDDEQIEEATGNEGATMERWYHHAALVMWPHTNHWKIACTNSLSTAMKVGGPEYRAFCAASMQERLQVYEKRIRVLSFSSTFS